MITVIREIPNEIIPTNKNGKYQKSSDLSLALKLLNISCTYIIEQNIPIKRNTTDINE